MGKYSLVAWCIIVLFPLVCKSQELQFMPVHFSEKYQYSSIGGMTQDLNGYVWLADMSFGLFRYDGVGFSHYSHNPYNRNSVNSDLLGCVAADKKGNIWIGTNQNGLDRLEPETAIFTHYTHADRNRASLCNDSLSTLLVDRGGTLWIGTSDGLDTLDSKTGEFIHITGKTSAGATLKREHVNALYQDRAGIIWIGCGSAYRGEGPANGLGGLYKYDKRTGSVIHYLHNNNDLTTLTDDRVGAIFEDSRDVFWVGTAGDGLHAMNRENGTFARYLYDPHNPQKLSRPAVKNTLARWVDHITFINEDESGFIWIGTLGNGINRYDPLSGICRHFSKEENGASRTTTDNYWTCIKTRDNLLWMSSFGSGNLQQLLCRVITAHPKIGYKYLGKQPYSFANGADSSIWVGTSGSRLLHVKDNRRCDTFLVGKNRIPVGKGIIFLENDGAGGLWVSTFGNGLYRYNTSTGSSTAYKHDDKNPNSLASDEVFATQLDGNGKTWIGTQAGLDLLDVKTGRFAHYKSDPKDSATLSNDFITAIKKDSGANIWAGTTDGINHLTIKTQKCRQYLKGNNIFGIAIDGRNRVWVSTQNSGLYLYNAQADKFTQYEDTGGLIKDDMPVFSIVEDKRHYLWLSTQSGFIKLNPEEKTAWWYGKSWGITSLTGANLISAQGEIYNGESAGYYHFLPGSLSGGPSNYQQPFLSKFYLGNNPIKPGAVPFLPQPLSQTKQIELKYSQNNFAMAYNYVDFLTNPEDITIEYKLENYDDAWRKSGEEKKANYYNVPPGKYIFRLRALNMFGNWSAKSITIIITPPWWQTWWAYILYAALGTGGVWGFIYLRSRRLIKENKLLEQKVKLRTEEVMTQKAELIVQRDNLEKTLAELKSAQKQLIQSEKMASLGELTSGIAHEIQNPLNFVNNFSEVSIEMLDELATELTNGDKEEAAAIAEDLKQTLEKINQHGKRADSIVKGMLQHSRQSPGVKEIIDINKLVDEFFKLAYHGLRAKDKDFNAELVTHFDEKLPKANVVPQDMGRVMLNLFNNAFYAVNQKKKTLADLSVGAGPDYKGEVSVATSLVNNEVVIKVKDNGTGIPEAIKDKIMQPFFTTKPTGEGTGLGLSLTYDMVVKGHGGTIEVNSKDGTGAEFVISLPVG